MKIRLSWLCTFLILIAMTRVATGADPCLPCHEKETPAIVRIWAESAHAAKRVSCKDCHGADIDANHSRQTRVEAETCGSCHGEEFAAHKLSKHGIGLKAGQGCTRRMPETADQLSSCIFCHEEGSTQPRVNVDCAMFLAQSPEMQAQGCTACHRVESRCDSCHTKHGTDPKIAGTPETCGMCHMGPDHPQYEMWESSPHGVLWRERGEKIAPSCVACHMPEGTHNVSRGISVGLPPGQEERIRRERDFMILICAKCHTAALATRNLADADAIEKQSRLLLDEARTIIEALNRDRLLMPSPEERVPHPIAGSNFVIGPHMLYENLSQVESTYFKMKQFYYMSAFKGVYHQNPDYAHWFGNAPLKLALSEIRSQGALLRRLDALGKRIDNIGAHLDTGDSGNEQENLKRRLRSLKDQLLRGDISEDSYQKDLERLLDDAGL